MHLLLPTSNRVGRSEGEQQREVQEGEAAGGEEVATAWEDAQMQDRRPTLLRGATLVVGVLRPRRAIS